MFEFTADASDGAARRGVLQTPRGPLKTPAFMPVGTAASVKGLTAAQIRDCGAQMVLANTYHLLCRPGPGTVAALGGVHEMMAWDGPVLTDSGGFQVFSLSGLRTLDEQGVTFQSHVDGSRIHLTCERAVKVQTRLGADVMMQLDECPPAGAGRAAVEQAVERSLAWARRCRDAWRAARREGPQTPHGREQALFGIQQGGTNRDLRRRSIEGLIELDLPGYAVGGLSVGEGHEAMMEVLEDVPGGFPAGKPRYLMGVGEPRDILGAVQRGVDMFDCVLPTRNGRNAQAFTFSGRFRLRNARFATDRRPIEDGCDCYACRNYSRGTIRHLFMAREMLGPTLVSLHNLRFFARLMAGIREAIGAGDLHSRAAAWMDSIYGPPEDSEPS